MVALYAALSRVLASRSDSSGLTQSLREFQQELEEADVASILDAYHSAMMPMVLIIQSSARLKKNPEADVQVPSAKSDRVVEYALGCMNAFMGARGVSDCKELLHILYTLADILTLKKSNSSEELRLLSLKCLCTLLENCSCLPTDIEDEFSASQPLEVVGFIVYQCISRAVEEGSKGNHQVVTHAYKAIKLLVQQIPVPKLWMALLPGCSAEFSRILSISGKGIGGSGPSHPRSAIVVEALHALQAVVDATLSDDLVAKVKPDTQKDSPSHLQNALEKIAARPPSSVNRKERAERDGEESQPTTLAPSPDGKLKGLLHPSLPSLLHHPATAVRRALGEVVVSFLSGCGLAFEELQRTLLEIVLTLAHDEWSKVSLPCKNYMQAVKAVLNGGKDDAMGISLSKNIERMVKTRSMNLHVELEAGYFTGFAAARQLASAMEVAGKERTFEWLIGSPPLLMTCLKSLVKCFDFDPLCAPILLRSTAQPGPYLPDQQQKKLKPSETDEVVTTTSTGEGIEGSPALQAAPVDLPRMPAGLRMMDEKVYLEIRKVAFLLGSASIDISLDAVQLVVDTLVEIMEQIMHHKSSHWALEAASVFVVLSEVLFGASKPHASLKGEHAQKLGDLTASLFENKFCEELWNLRTFNEEGNDSPLLGTEALGENALLQKALLETIGVFAKVLGKSFGKGGHILRIVIMPVLERLGDPCPLVQSAAEVTVRVICCHCGYDSLEDLVAENSDYVVDGLCSQLRQLSLFPRAPYLLAALLRRANMGPNLLPLLAEPARISLKGVAIISRRSDLRYTTTFSKAMLEISKCAQKEGQALAGESQEAAVVLSQRSKEHKKTQERFDDEQIHEWDESMDEFESKPTILLNREEEVALNERIQRTHAASVLASSVAELAAPLMLSKDNQVSLKAMSVCTGALIALSFTSQAHDIDTQLREEFISKQVLATSPVPPKPDMVLPSVHIVWIPLKTALKDSRIAVREGAMKSLVDITKAGGSDFLARRFKDDIWPILDMELRPHMTASPQLRALNREGGMAPNVVQRFKSCALECVRMLAEDDSTRLVFRGFVRQLVEVIVPYIGNSQTANIRELASRALIALAKLDVDAVWLLLTDIYASSGEAHGLPVNPKPGVLPSMEGVLPRCHGPGSRDKGGGDLWKHCLISKPFCVDCGGQAGTLLAKISCTEAAWHETALIRIG